MIELTVKDIQPLDTFVPQQTLAKINEAVKQKIKELCFRQGHIWELYKRGEIVNDYGTNFEALQWGHRCRFCRTILNPIAFEEV